MDNNGTNLDFAAVREQFGKGLRVVRSGAFVVVGLLAAFVGLRALFNKDDAPKSTLVAAEGFKVEDAKIGAPTADVPLVVPTLETRVDKISQILRDDKVDVGVRVVNAAKIFREVDTEMTGTNAITQPDKHSRLSDEHSDAYMAIFRFLSGIGISCNAAEGKLEVAPRNPENPSPLAGAVQVALEKYYTENPSPPLPTVKSVTLPDGTKIEFGGAGGQGR